MVSTSGVPIGPTCHPGQYFIGRPTRDGRDLAVRLRYGGVQAPNASGGLLISDRIQYIQTTPTFSLIPGAMFMLTGLSINLLGDGVRDALDPLAQVRIQT